MKRRSIRVIVVLLVLVVGWQFIETNHLFTDTYYVKVPSASKVERDASTYTYEMIGYDKDGKKRPIKLQSSSLLGEGDFLKVYVKDGDRVTAFEPANEMEVPSQLKDEQTDEPVTTPLP